MRPLPKERSPRALGASRRLPRRSSFGDGGMAPKVTSLIAARCAHCRRSVRLGHWALPPGTTPASLRWNPSPLSGDLPRLSTCGLPDFLVDIRQHRLRVGGARHPPARDAIIPAPPKHPPPPP